MEVVRRIVRPRLSAGAVAWRCHRKFSSWGKGVPVTMPALSPTMTSGKIGKWNKKEGDRVLSGDAIAEIETDKATVDFVHQDDGFLAKILVPAGSEDVPVGSVLALMVDEAQDLAAVQSATYAPSLAGNVAASTPAPPPANSQPPADPAAPAAVSAVAALASHQVMPSARILMANRGVDPAAVHAQGGGTGKAGRITKGDVLTLLAGGRIAPVSVAPPAASSIAAPVTPAPIAVAAASPVGPRGLFTDSKPSTIRKVIAARLTESKSRVPHQYAVMDCRIDALMALRSKLKALGVNISVNDMIIKACAKAMVDVPEVNRFYDAKADAVRAYTGGADICVAVATDGGLITPIVKSADRLGLFAINEAVKDLASRARAGKLKPDEFQGGSFTISNLGMFGIDEFTAVINPPQACILAVGRGESKVLLPPIKSEADLDPSAPMPTPSVETVMSVTLSSDARVVDDATAGQFLQVFRHLIENPSLLVA